MEVVPAPQTPGKRHRLQSVFIFFQTNFRVNPVLLVLLSLQILIYLFCNKLLIDITIITT